MRKVALMEDTIDQKRPQHSNDIFILGTIQFKRHSQSCTIVICRCHSTDSVS